MGSNVEKWRRILRRSQWKRTARRSCAGCQTWKRVDGHILKVSTQRSLFLIFLWFETQGNVVPRRQGNITGTGTSMTWTNPRKRPRQEREHLHLTTAVSLWKAVLNPPSNLLTIHKDNKNRRTQTGQLKPKRKETNLKKHSISDLLSKIQPVSTWWDEMRHHPPDHPASVRQPRDNHLAHWSNYLRSNKEHWLEKKHPLTTQVTSVARVARHSPINLTKSLTRRGKVLFSFSVPRTPSRGSALHLSPCLAQVVSLQEWLISTCWLDDLLREPRLWNSAIVWSASWKNVGMQTRNCWSWSGETQTSLWIRSQQKSIKTVCQGIHDEAARQDSKSLTGFSIVLSNATTWSCDGAGLNHDVCWLVEHRDTVEVETLRHQQSAFPKNNPGTHIYIYIHISIRLPAQDRQINKWWRQVGKLIKNTHGTQDASHIWQLDYVNLNCGELGGFRRGKHNAALFHNSNVDASMMVHVDDIVCLSDDDGVTHIDELCKSKYR